MPMVDGVGAREGNVTRGLFHCCGRSTAPNASRAQLSAPVIVSKGPGPKGPLKGKKSPTISKNMHIYPTKGGGAPPERGVVKGPNGPERAEIKGRKGPNGPKGPKRKGRNKGPKWAQRAEIKGPK